MKNLLTFIAIASLALLSSCSKPVADSTLTPFKDNLTFDMSEVTLYVGDKVTPELQGLQDGEKVTYESGDKTIAIVSTKGVITAKKEGETVVSAISKTDASRKASITVKVEARPADYVSITGITVSPATLSVKEGESADLPSATVAPANATDKDNVITWKSANESIAIIEGSKVKGIAAGEVEIIATIKDNKGTEFSGKCTVTVRPSVIPTTGIKLSNSSLKIQPGKTAELSVSFIPEDHTDNLAVTWETNKASVATVANGVVTAVAEGSATITAKAGSFSATCDVTVADIELMLNSKKCFFDYTWPDDLKTLDNVSMEAWVLTSGKNTGLEAVIGIEGVFLIRTEGSQWQLVCGGDKKSDGEYSKIKISTFYNDYLNKWTHLAATYSRAGKAYLYVNGEKKGEAEVKDHGVDMNGVDKDGNGTIPNYKLPFSFMIGNACDGDRYVQGSIAYARIWKKALSQEEVQANMSKAAVTSSDLVASWYFTEGSGNTIADHSGNNRTLIAKKYQSEMSYPETDIEWIEGSLPAVK